MMLDDAVANISDNVHVVKEGVVGRLIGREVSVDIVVVSVFGAYIVNMIGGGQATPVVDQVEVSGRQNRRR